MSITTQRVRQVAQGRTGNPADTFTKLHVRGDGRQFYSQTVKARAGWTCIVFDPESGHILSAVDKEPHTREDAVRQLVEWMS